jgi:hypothetical protein
MSILASQTEKRALNLLVQCLPHLEKLQDAKMTAEDAFDVRQAENNFHRIIDGKQDNPLTINCLPVTKPYLYVLVIWPEVQELMEFEWFREECTLYQAPYGQKYLSSAYFVPLRRIIEIDS